MMNWADSYDTCETLGLQLLKITDEQTRMYVQRTILNHAYHEDVYNIWLDGEITPNGEIQLRNGTILTYNLFGAESMTAFAGNNLQLMYVYFYYGIQYKSYLSYDNHHNNHIYNISKEYLLCCWFL